MELVTASLASIPSRKRLLGRCARSLLPQVGRLNVYLNGYDEIPGFLDHPKIRVERSQDHGDIGDAGKCWFLDETPTGYYFTCDDDIVYPHDYVERLRRAMDRDRKSIWGVHGIVLREEITRYYRSRRFVFSYESELEEDTRVHALGTGSAAWHTSAIQLSRTDFPVPNMADIWLAVAARRQDVPVWAIARDPKWLRVMNVGEGPHIYGRYARGGDELHTWLIKAFAPWPEVEVPKRYRTS